MKNFILKGNICYLPSIHELKLVEQGYLVSSNGKSLGVFPMIPEKYQNFPVIDYKDSLLFPGLVNLHVHASQYPFRGLDMDKKQLEYLAYAKYKDLTYAQKALTYFVEDLKRGATSRACILATTHREATNLLMQLLDEAGIGAYVGKINIDKNNSDYLNETTKESIEETRRFIMETQYAYPLVKPILTPHFLSSCSDELMASLHEIQELYTLPVQTHFSKNYYKSPLLGEKNVKTVMAHCVYFSEKELDLIKKQGVMIAYCLLQTPIRYFLDLELNVGFGSNTSFMFDIVKDAIQDSKFYWHLVDSSMKPLTMTEALYLATKGGGSFFGKVGSFEKDYDLDVLVLSDKRLPYLQPLSLAKRLERLIYLADEREIIHKYVAGKQIF